MNAWMTCFIEDLHQCLKGVRCIGKERHVLSTIYNALLPVATASLQAEFI